MDFAFSDDQQLLRTAVAKWVEKAFPASRRAALVKAGGKTRAIYGELAELGLTALTLSEAHGGTGFGAVEAMIVMEELGRGLVNTPYAAAALISPFLLQAGSPDQQDKWLPGIGDGSILIIPALQERASRYDLQRVVTKAQAVDGGFRLDGQKSVVPAADEADAFIVPARLAGNDDDPNGIGLFIVEANSAGVGVKAYPTQDGARAGELILNGVTASPITLEGWSLLEQAVDIGIAAACAEGVGAMDVLATLTADYLNTRKQFGVPLSSFQALRHRMADVKLHQELGRSMSYYATLRLADPPARRRRALSQAKVQLGQSMRFVGQACTQLHGGIGLTEEYVGSHYFKRLTLLEMAYGDTLHHLGEVARHMQPTAGVHA